MSNADQPIIFSKVIFPNADLQEDVYIVAYPRDGSIDFRTAVYMNEAQARDLWPRMQWILDGPATTAE